MSQLLYFENLHPRHPLDLHQLKGYANAAKVCLDVHHTSPVTFEATSNGKTVSYVLSWEPTDEILQRSYNNADDAKRDGAYVIAFAAIEDLRGLVSVGRAETKTGADYYLAPIGSDPSDFEKVLRLEVSGTDGSPSEIRSRLRQKQQQTRDGTGKEPAIAAVIGFRSRLILVENA